jgi:teichuronic acid exporter
MATSLKQKTVNGVIWSSAGGFCQHGIQFIVGIILARILLPEEFGLIGMIIIFIAISSTITESGFIQALIQKKDATQLDYDTIFVFNVIISVILYVLLFLFARFISDFFSEPQLIPLIRVLAVTLIISSLSFVHITKLTKEVNFKKITYSQIIASLFSGFIAIILALKGFGVWSLVLKFVIFCFVQSTLYWYYKRWFPKLQFSWKSFKKLFSFGSKIFVVRLIGIIYKKLYYVVIGRAFSSSDLGFYTRAEQFTTLSSQKITSAIQHVTFAALSSIQEEQQRLKTGFRRTIQLTMFVTFPLLIGLAVVAEPLILILIGEKWEQSIPYLQLLCFVGIFHPLHIINLDMFNVKGRSELSLKIEMFKTITVIPIIVISIGWGIRGLIIGLLIHSMFCYFLCICYSGRIISYSVYEQLRDIYPSFFVAIIMGIMTFIFGSLLPDINGLKLVLQIFMSIGIYYFLSKFLNSKIFNYFIEIMNGLIKKKTPVAK